VVDHVFAIARVSAVTLLFGLVRAPEASDLAMAAGVVAYYGFVASAGAARRGDHCGPQTR